MVRTHRKAALYTIVTNASGLFPEPNVEQNKRSTAHDSMKDHRHAIIAQ